MILKKKRDYHLIIKNFNLLLYRKRIRSEHLFKLHLYTIGTYKRFCQYRTKPMF